MPLTTLSPADKLRFAELLAEYFPWLTDETEDANGADTVNTLAEVYGRLTGTQAGGYNDEEL